MYVFQNNQSCVILSLAAGLLTSRQYLFHFTVRELEPYQHTAPRFTEAGHWLPPRPRFHNRVVVDDRDPIQPNGLRACTYGYHNYTSYSFDSDTNALYERREAIPNIHGLRPIREVSMYYAQGTIWLVDYPVNGRSVGNGRERNGEDSSDEEDQDAMGEEDRVDYDWEMLRFRHPGGGESLVDYAADQGQLHATRRDQTWPSYLLPDTYLPQPSRHRVRHRNEPYGSLNGNLAVLIGLVAFTADDISYNVHQTLMHTIRGASWTLPPNQVRGIGRMFPSLPLCLTIPSRLY
jgi:hypothetical protein